MYLIDITLDSGHIPLKIILVATLRLQININISNITKIIYYIHICIFVTQLSRRGTKLYIINYSLNIKNTVLQPKLLLYLSQNKNFPDNLQKFFPHLLSTFSDF